MTCRSTAWCNSLCLLACSSVPCTLQKDYQYLDERKELNTTHTGVFEVEDQHIFNALLSVYSSSYFLSLPITLSHTFKTFLIGCRHEVCLKINVLLHLYTKQSTFLLFWGLKINASETQCPVKILAFNFSLSPGSRSPNTYETFR